jgi:hypothetical protein
VKNTRSKRVSDTVHFKHKYITQPTLTPEDTIVKAHALKESRNTKGISQIKAPLKMDELFNKGLTSTVDVAGPPQEKQPSPRVIFADMSKPLQEIPTPRVAIEKTPNPRVTIETATIDKAISDDLPHPRELGAKLNTLYN